MPISKDDCALNAIRLLEETQKMIAEAAANPNLDEAGAMGIAGAAGQAIAMAQVYATLAISL